MTLMAIIILLSGTAFGNTDAPPMDFSAGATAAGPAPGCSVTEVFSAQGPRLNVVALGNRCMNGYPLLMESKAREGTKQCTDCCLPVEPEQGRHSMATQWGLNTLGPGKSASWFFGRS